MNQSCNLIHTEFDSTVAEVLKGICGVGKCLGRNDVSSFKFKSPNGMWLEELKRASGAEIFLCHVAERLSVALLTSGEGSQSRGLAGEQFRSGVCSGF